MVRGAPPNERRTWIDWVGIGLGILIGLTPWFAGLPENQALVFGVAV